MITEFLATFSLLFLQSASADGAAPKDKDIRFSAEQRASLRCAAAFAVIAAYQDLGEEKAQQWPEMNVRGREFFVRTSARLIDETGADRKQIEASLSREATNLSRTNQLEAVKPACLLLLEASGV